MSAWTWNQANDLPRSFTAKCWDDLPSQPSQFVTVPTKDRIALLGGAIVETHGHKAFSPRGGAQEKVQWLQLRQQFLPPRQLFEIRPTPTQLFVAYDLHLGCWQRLRKMINMKKHKHRNTNTDIHILILIWFCFCIRGLHDKNEPCFVQFISNSCLYFI